MTSDFNGVDAEEELAGRLTIHHNTVKQRMRKIRELAGIDVKSYDAVAEIVLVLQWDAYLQESA